MHRPRIYINGDKGDNVETLIMIGRVSPIVYDYAYTHKDMFDRLDVRIEKTLTRFQEFTV